MKHYNLLKKDLGSTLNLNLSNVTIVDSITITRLTRSNNNKD